MSTQESRTEYAVHVTTSTGLEKVTHGGVDADVAESLAADLNASEWFEAHVVSRTVTTTAWVKVRDHVAEAAEVRKQRQG